MADEILVLTVDEVAELLRVAPADVRGLLEGGDLAGVRVAGAWRVPWPAVEVFLERGIEKAQQEAITRAITDPRSWARAVQSDRRMLAQLEERDFEEGTFGAWLKAALRAEEAEAEAGNVVPIDGPRGG